MSLSHVDTLLKSRNKPLTTQINEPEEDIYSGYDSVPPEYNLNDLAEDEEFQEALKSVTWGKRSVTPKPPSTAWRLGTGYSRQGTGFRPKTGRLSTSSSVRPSTAIRGAGYSSNSRSFDPYSKGPKVLGSVSEARKEETPAMKFKSMEKKITSLLEECYLACAIPPGENFMQFNTSPKVPPDYTATLAKAREASTLERALIRMQEEAGHKDHNFDLTYSVLYNMAMQYSFNEMYEEALNAYTLMTKNKLFSNSYRLKLNMGNIYFKMGQNKKAIKMYHMSLDQVPNTQKEFRLKIMHNLAATFVAMGQFQEASTNFEYIMSEKGDIKSGLRLVLCYYAMEDVDQMKVAFKKLLSVDLDMLDTDSYIDPIVDPDLTILKEVILSDDMSEIEEKLKHDAERCILLAAKLISPVIEDSFIDGYNWCVNCLKDSYYSVLANELEMNNAIALLKRNEISQAIDTLKVFEKKEDKIAHMASVNLSFIYYLQEDFETAEKYTVQAKKFDSYSPAAYVNHGACLIAKGDLNKAKDEFLNALSNDAACIEAIYNLGLVHKAEGKYEESLDCFRKLEVIYGTDLISPLLYQLAHLYELKGDYDAANEWYMQVIGLDPTDPSILQKMGEMYARDNDKHQAFTYMLDSFRFYPSNFTIINWLGSFHVEQQQAEKAHAFFERAAVASPKNAKWYLLSASCYRKTGDYQKALTLYTEVHKMFPENVECLKSLIEMCNNQGLKEADHYAAELKRVEKSKDARERIGSARPGSRRNSSGLSSHGMSPNTDNYRFSMESPVSPLNARTSAKSMNRNMNNKALRNIFVQDSIESGGSDGIVPYTNNALEGIMLGNLEYDDPIGPAPDRPRTVMKLGISDTFKNQDLGDDLLPS